MSYNSGDIVLYRSYGPSLMDRFCTAVVQKMTHGPYVHVAVIVDSIKNKDEITTWRTIEATGRGIVYGEVPLERSDYTIVSVRDFARKHDYELEDKRIEEGIAWLKWAVRIGEKYSYLELVDQGLKIIFRSIPTIHLSMAKEYDCSNLAAAYLTKIGTKLPHDFEPPYDISPNDVADFFELLPSRHQIGM